MKNFLIFFLLFGLVSGVYGQSKETPVGSLETYEGAVKYDLELKTYEKGKEKEPGLVVKTTVWRKGNLERKESEIKGMKLIVFTLKDGIYNYMPGQKMAMKQPLPEVKPQPMEAKPEEKVKVPEPKKIGEEKCDDKLCEVYEQELTTKDEKTGEETKFKTKCWFWKEKKIALKTITTTEGKDEKGKITTIIIENIYKNIDFKDIPDSVFALPEGTQIMDMPKMSAPGAPGMMPTPPAKTLEDTPAKPEEKPKKKGFGVPKLF